MTGVDVAYDSSLDTNEQSVLKILGPFEKIQDAIGQTLKLIHKAEESVHIFPQYMSDIQSIVTACEEFTQMVEKDRTLLVGKVRKKTLTEADLKTARHDLRAKVSAILGYSELVLEELMDSTPTAASDFILAFEMIIEIAKNLIPVIDDLRVDVLNQEVEYFMNETPQEVHSLSENNLTYGEQFADCTVLIVDDSVYNREILSRRLSRYGVKVDTAENGVKGLEVVANKQIDLILLDIMMPVMNGYEVLTQLKADEASKNIPVLMISALSEVDSIVRCIEVGAEDYLPTPFNPIVLHARIRACLEKKILRDREKESQDKLQAAIESINDGFAVFDKDRTLSMSNKKFHDLYPGVEKLGNHGFTYEELLRENYDLGVYFQDRRNSHEMSQDDLKNWIRQFSTKQEAGEGYLIRLKDGRWIEVINSATPGGGQVSVHKDVTNQKEDEDRLTYQALHDTLTGLANRASFEAHLQASIQKCSEKKTHFSLMFLDLDGFKGINDTLGHEVGDRVLIHVSKVLSECVRDKDVVARLGGDEFAIILNTTTGTKNLEMVSQRILENIGKDYTHGGEKLPFGISIGIARFPEDADSAEKILACSDEAMYAAKKAGKGQFKFYSSLQKS